MKIEAYNIKVGRDLNANNTTIGNVSLQGLTSEEQEKIRALEDQIKEASQKGDNKTVKFLVSTVMDISKKVGASFLGKYISGI